MALSPENFERLMNWLHSNREEAGHDYQRIRKLLIKNFKNRRCSNPDDLADMTLDRAAETLTTEIIKSWAGPKERYFYRVAYYILLEQKGKHLPETQMPDGFEVPEADEPNDRELTWYCLEECLQKQPLDRRELIVRYYRGMKAIKKKNREELARELRITLPTLRVRARRIREELKTCIERCLEDAARHPPHSLQM